LSQPFSPRSNSLARLSIFIAIVGGLACYAVGATLTQSGYHTGVGESIEQPIPFSHKHHVQGLGLDCRFCHTTVERSASAGFPDTKTCMTCHSQIWKDEKILKPVRDSYRTGQPLLWYKVNRLPDYVYFNHSAHVNKGVGCVSCHGEVSKEPTVIQVRSFFMKDCMSCHLSPEGHLRPVSEEFNEDWTQKNDFNHDDTIGMRLMHDQHVKVQRITDCSRCHL
jgi:hypothetical protein